MRHVLWVVFFLSFLFVKQFKNKNIMQKCEISEEQFSKKEEFEQLGISFALEAFDKFDINQQAKALRQATVILQDKWHGTILDLEHEIEHIKELLKDIE